MGVTDRVRHMSSHQALRRVPVPQQYAQNLKTVTIPAPTKGIIESENEAFIQPGAAIVQDNWVSTMRGVKLRGGFVRWCELPTPAPIISGFEYTQRQHGEDIRRAGRGAVRRDDQHAGAGQGCADLGQLCGGAIFQSGRGLADCRQ